MWFKWVKLWFSKMQNENFNFIEKLYKFEWCKRIKLNFLNKISAHAFNHCFPTQKQRTQFIGLCNRCVQSSNVTSYKKLYKNNNWKVNKLFFSLGSFIKKIFQFWQVNISVMFKAAFMETINYTTFEVMKLWN